MKALDWILQHRLLLIIYVAGGALAISELRLPPEQAGALDGAAAYLDSEASIADVSAEIYPDRALTLYYQAFQKSLCGGPARTRPEGCDARGPVDPEEVSALIKRAIAKGNRSIEQLLYNYAVVLVQEGAPEAEIEAAIRNWRVAHPTSERPDPRKMRRAAKPRNAR